MIISHQHKYLFIEVPHTACTSIGRALRAEYDGEPIMWKHATYREFLKTASEEEKSYFVFAGVRNPLDVAVTQYLRYKTDHGNSYTKPKKPGSANVTTLFQRMAFQYTQRPESDFAAYFRRCHKLPYDDSVSRDARQYAQFFIRFEHLEEDFAEVLRRIGIEQKGPLPHVNKTATKARNYLSYYTPDITEQATRVFGPCMEEWGYELPPAWRTSSIPPMSQFNYRVVNFLRDFYWHHVKWSPRFYGRLSRMIK
jgi:hypothetical protein